ncbi:MAG: hypothetical protein ACREIT_04015, partial [Tepidisphaeraceae bacterium]
TQASTETTTVPAMPATATATTVATTAPATQAGGPDSAAVVQMLRGDTATPLFRLDWPVWHMALSPDGAWLALLSFNEETDRCNLHAFSLESRRLYILSESCGNAMCFTGPRRLAYVRPDCDNENFEHLTGKLVEVKLEDESLPELARTELLDVVPAHTPWMQALPEGDLLFTAFPRSFPASATIQPSEESAYKLFHFSRPNRGVTAIVEEAGRLFLPSPDGKRVLFEKITPATSAMPMKRELALMNANGSDVTVLRDLGQYTDLPMWPTWRGNDEIAFVPPSNPTTRPAAVDGDQRVHFDVVLYRLVNGATLDVEPARVLSTGWPDAMKPFMKLAAPEPTTKE